VHLKSLTLKGFKSFAAPTTFVFEPGVTCVVGPNGSGKSNLVDALAWVMGEQGAKTLRGGSMEDVIFAGTASKAPLGRAEVLLTIDNSDGMLPIEYSEVTISRTLFRNGGSEYAINKQPCRLLDVQELLSDSGLGREMHVIVGQGQLDQVLHASPEDRRRFIEEAAGILKHRRRKEKTERKLESMQANLTRLNDLAGEIRRQLTPLGRQAEIAREAQTIQAVVRDAQARVFADDVVGLTRALDDFLLNEHERATERAALSDSLDSVRGRITALESEDSALELDTARNIDYSLKAVLERLQALSSIAQERAGALGVEAPEATGLLGVSPEDLVAKDQAVSDLATEVETQEKNVGELSGELATMRASLQAIDREIASLVGEVSAYDTTLRDLESTRDVAASRVHQAVEEAKRQQAATEQAKERVQAAGAKLQALEAKSEHAPDAVAEAFEKALAEAESQLNEATTAENETRDRLHQHEREQEALAAKVSALTLALRLEEVDPEVATAPGVSGSVADALVVTSGYETAIAQALGSLADALLITNSRDALALMESRRSKTHSRVELVIAEYDGTPGETLDGLKGAWEVVSGPKGVMALLSRTYIATDHKALAKVFGSPTGIPDDVTVVTLTGEVVTNTVVRMGSGESRSRIELAAERDQAQTAVGSLSTELERTRFALEEATKKRLEYAELAKTALADLRLADAKRAQFGEQVSSAKAVVAAAEADVERLTQRAEEAAEAVEVGNAALAAAEAALTQFAAVSRPSIDDSERVALVAELEARASKEVEARVALEAARERLKNAQESAAELRARHAEEQAAREREIAQHQERLAKQQRAQQVLAFLPGVVALCESSVREANTRLIAAEASRQARHGELTALRQQESSVRERLTQITDSVHSLEMQIYEKKLQRNTLLERVAEELGLSEEALLEDYAPHVLVPPDTLDGDSAATPFDRSQQEQRLAKARKKLDQLGRVNPLALEEFQALEQRHTFLTEQLADLKKTRADLESIMAELDDTMQGIFLEAFEDTQRAFDEVFPILFPGGTGSLTLTDPHDVLVTGIEVSVRPAGKKIERLSLLSGGERSLAAVALLIAIFKARPSPFYILDEVEAALDDANLGRLLSVIESLRQDSQLIVITHQKRTMEIADALYGVSMRKDGVSAVVGQRVRESEAIAS
jgi:chromosome segregation protein